MSRFEVDRRGAAVIERGFPASNADAPTIAGFQSWKAPFRHRRHQIVPIEDGEIEKFLGDFHADGVEPDVLRPGAAISVPIKSRHGIATTTTQFGAENVGRHGDMLPKERRFPNRRCVSTVLQRWRSKNGLLAIGFVRQSPRAVALPSSSA